MSSLSKTIVDQALKEIESEVRASSISKKSLVKFTDSKEDKIFFSYFNGSEDNYHQALPLLINKLNLKNIVELGSREGISTLCMWDKLPKDASLTTIDILKDQRYCPDAMFTDTQVNFIFGDVCDLSIFKGDIPLDIDFLFSDTVHYNFQITDEFEVYQHLLADKALVAIDDIYVNDKHKFFEKIPYTKWDLTELYHRSGWGLFLYERNETLPREERILKAYQAAAALWQRKCLENEALLEKEYRKKPLNILKNCVKKITPLYKLLTYSYNNYSAIKKKNNRSK
jgi:predicted O-methyltransferase YrrM